MQRHTKEQAYYAVINDGINVFVREVLEHRGYLDLNKADERGLIEIIELKHQIASGLARKWAMLPLQGEVDPIDQENARRYS